MGSSFYNESISICIIFLDLMQVFRACILHQRLFLASQVVMSVLVTNELRGPKLEVNFCNYSGIPRYCYSRSGWLGAGGECWNREGEICRPF